MRRGGSDGEVLRSGVLRNGEVPLCHWLGSHLTGDVKSKVSGHVMEGVFDGTITTSEGEYHVEHARKFFSEREKRDFHSVIYRTSDVDFDQSESSCAAKGELLEQMRRLQSTARPIKKHGGTISEYLVNREKQKRATFNGATFCPMLIAADNLFLQQVGGGDAVATTSEIVTTMAQVGKYLHVFCTLS